MQSIKHTQGFKYPHWLMGEIDSLYADLSDNSQQITLFSQVYANNFKEIYEIFKEYGTWDMPDLMFQEKAIEPLKLPKYDPKNIIVCYSGGKDSLCAVRHYQKLGYNVYAYHIKGLNKTYADEWKVAQLAADTLGFKLEFGEIGYSGQHNWVEHPMKNMIMANMALSYGIQNNITTKVACGSFYSAFLNDVPFAVCAGDTKDMWEAYDRVISKIIPKWHMYIPNKNYQTSYRMLLKEPELIPYTISCLTPVRFRQLFRDRTIRNYGVDLMHNRCGCCWKCAAEYIFFCDHNILEFNKEYYLHCVEILVNTLEQEMGYRVFNLDRVWNNYMFYPLKKSKAYKELENAVILSTGIKFT